jgi:hypothetical protein
MTAPQPPPTPEDVAAAGRLAALLAAHSDEEIEAALPILFLGAARGLPDLVLPPAAEERIGRFMEDHGLSGAATPDALLAGLDRVLQEARSPLLSALARFFREESARSDGGGARAFAAFVGSAAKGVLDSGVRPPGTVAAGPLARFLVEDLRTKR